VHPALPGAVEVDAMRGGVEPEQAGVLEGLSVDGGGGETESRALEQGPQRGLVRHGAVGAPQAGQFVSGHGR